MVRNMNFACFIELIFQLVTTENYNPYKQLYKDLNIYFIFVALFVARARGVHKAGLQKRIIYKRHKFYIFWYTCEQLL